MNLIKKFVRCVKSIYWTRKLAKSDKGQLWSDLVRIRHNMIEYRYTDKPKYKGDFYPQFGICLNLSTLSNGKVLRKIYANWPDVHLNRHGKPDLMFPVGGYPEYDQEKSNGKLWYNQKRYMLLHWLIEELNKQLTEELESKLV